MKVLCTSSEDAQFSKAMKISYLQETVLRKVYDVGLMTQARRRHTGFVVRLMTSWVKYYTQVIHLSLALIAH